MSLRIGLRIGVPERNPSWDSNARTHAQTDTPTTSADHLTLVDVRRGEEGFTTIGQAINDGILPTGARHEVPDDARHLGSTIDGPYVWHVYEVTTDLRAIAGGALGGLSGPSSAVLRP